MPNVLSVFGLGSGLGLGLGWLQAGGGFGGGTVTDAVGSVDAAAEDVAVVAGGVAVAVGCADRDVALGWGAG